MTAVPKALIFVFLWIVVLAGCDGLGGSDEADVENARSDRNEATIASAWAALLSKDDVDDEVVVTRLLAMSADEARAARYRPAGGAWTEATKSVVIGEQMISMDRATLEPVVAQIKATARRRGATEGDKILLVFEALLAGITESTEQTPAVYPWLIAMSLRIDALESLSDTSSVEKQIKRLKSELERRIEITPGDILRSL